jgi:hypothetical protein
MLSEGLRRHHPHHSYKLGNGAHFASHGLAALSRAPGKSNRGIVMKSIRAIAPVGRSKLTKQAKSKRGAAASIAQRYRDLVRLRGQVHELETRQRSAEYSGPARSAPSRPPSGESYQLRIV